MGTPTPARPVIFGDLGFHPAAVDDAEFAADVQTAKHPEDPWDPMLARFWWSIADPNFVFQRYLILHQDTKIGVASMTHPEWAHVPRRFAHLDSNVLPELESAERTAAAYDFIEELGREAGAEVLTAVADETDAFKAEQLRSRGYKEVSRQRKWELDLAGNRDRLTEMAAASRRRMREEGVELTTMDQRPDRLHQTYLVSDQAQADIPQDAPYVSMTEETFRRWFSAPGHHPDRIWIACQGDDVLGVSLLVYPPVRGHVRTQWTGTARAARGRGVARALKLETLLQAIEFGVPLVRTDNDHRNAPILHLNQDFGYQAVPGLIRFQKQA